MSHYLPDTRRRVRQRISASLLDPWMPNFMTRPTRVAGSSRRDVRPGRRGRDHSKSVLFGASMRGADSDCVASFAEASGFPTVRPSRSPGPTRPEFPVGAAIARNCACCPGGCRGFWVRTPTAGDAFSVADRSRRDLPWIDRHVGFRFPRSVPGALPIERPPSVGDHPFATPDDREPCRRGDRDRGQSRRRTVSCSDPSPGHQPSRGEQHERARASADSR